MYGIFKQILDFSWIKLFGIYFSRRSRNILQKSTKRINLFKFNIKILPTKAIGLVSLGRYWSRNSCWYISVFNCVWTFNCNILWDCRYIWGRFLWCSNIRFDRCFTRHSFYWRSDMHHFNLFLDNSSVRRVLLQECIICGTEESVGKLVLYYQWVDLRPISHISRNSSYPNNDYVFFLLFCNWYSALCSS